jgi:hypothetical protein
VVNGDSIEVGCALDRGTLATCDAEAFAGTTAARLVKVGGGHTRIGKGRRGSVNVRLTRAGMKLLRSRRRASQLVISVRARAAGATRVLRDRRSVRVLLAGTELRPAGVFAPFSTKLPRATRASLRRFARDLRSAKVVRCEGLAAGSARGHAAEALGLGRARAACGYLRRLGVRARLRVVSSGTTGAPERRVLLRVLS